ncbi:T-complex protein 1 subunit delta [Datura stramonium]|uniref:T-complex protein 1 subunit delta n=1 Tax=Datura stramonium TaxID=4076 RepID=A0ABS8T4X1_DATST|nr:T-complex protein 1 subunit delta [Datura stramonium]
MHTKPAKTETFVDNKRKDDIRMANIAAAQAVANAVHTSFGPKGMDKWISTANGEIIISNYEATILNKMEVLQPATKFLVELSKSQDVVAGDGTTTGFIIASALLKQCLSLLPL